MSAQIPLRVLNTGTCHREREREKEKGEKTNKYVSVMYLNKSELNTLEVVSMTERLLRV
jgi:hypothetical protein